MAAMQQTFNLPGGNKETFKATSATGSLYDAFKHIDKRILSMVLAGVYRMREAAQDLATIGENQVRLSIAKPGSYKPYHKRGRMRMSSQPGTPPAAEQGGDLEPSIYSKVVSKQNQNPAVAEFGAAASFARDLEFGTNKIEPRPFMLPARQKVASVAQQRVARHLQQAYAKSAKKGGKNTFVIKMEA
jgi:hypothetical protein